MKTPGYVVFVGGPCVDEYYTVETWPSEGDKFLGRFLGNVPGGMIANAACVCAGYGVETYCFDRRGNNDVTQSLLEDLREYGVDASRIVLEEGFVDTKCIIFQGLKERTILVVQGNKKAITPTQQQLDLFRGAEFLYTSTHYKDLFDDFKALLADIKQRGVKIVFDNESSTYHEGWEDILRFAHTVFFNEMSFDLFRENKSEADFFNMLFGWGIEYVVITLGREGCVVKAANGEHVSVGTYGVEVVDTTSAGDTFNSSFMVALQRGWPIREAAVFSTAAANMAIMGQGPRVVVGPEERVRRFMEENASRLTKGIDRY